MVAAGFALGVIWGGTIMVIVDRFGGPKLACYAGMMAGAIVPFLIRQLFA